MPSPDDITAALRRAAPAGVQATIPALVRLLVDVASARCASDENLFAEELVCELGLEV